MYQVLDSLAAIQVPHAWFVHFYIVSVASSIFWGFQIFAQGSYLRAIDERAAPRSRQDVMFADPVVLAWALMSIQGARRLLESLRTRTQSESKMFVAHWLLGIIFYFAMGVAVWAEEIGIQSVGI